VGGREGGRNYPNQHAPEMDDADQGPLLLPLPRLAAAAAAARLLLACALAGRLLLLLGRLALLPALPLLLGTLLLLFGGKSLADDEEAVRGK